ncbi:hypothetical protein [Nitrobacter vulgaris]|uniref:Uncharacterized protein n=1 Tax=Nitrobacter vulgaris TaxID=29421 RepID=A0A1V4I2T9_NITVU|nr:hypothetical protein [Nitrobacter vulgaris]OPH84434.1 hypothetical protein B2M20_01455 [Nitrobacter vulgaris]
MNYANDNSPRTPAEHRAMVAEQSTTGERTYQSGSWPQGNRLHKAGNIRLLGGLASWQLLNSMPRLAAANDNQSVNAACTEITERDVVDADTIMAAVEAEKKEPGKHYREDTQEIFVVSKRDEEGQPIKGEWRSIAGVSFSSRRHSGAKPDWSVDDVSEEDKRLHAIDCERIREKLGAAVCTLLDLAASGATTTEIADSLSVSRAKAEKYVDAVIEKYLSVAA